MPGFLTQKIGLILMAGVLGACGTDGYSTTPTSVRAESGGTVELTGTWKSDCYDDGGADTIRVREYTSNGRVSIYMEAYSTSNLTCTTLSTTTYTATSASIYVQETKTASGWANGSGTTGSAAPTAVAGGSLSAIPTVSKYTLRLDSGSSMKSIDLIDDSDANSWLMYTADTLAAEDVADGYDDFLATANPLYKQ